MLGKLMSSEAPFAKRTDYFQPGAIDARMASLIVASQHPATPPVCAEDLADGTWYVTKWLDTTTLDASIDDTIGPSASTHKGGGKVPANDSTSKVPFENQQIHVLNDTIVVWREYDLGTVGDLIFEATGVRPEVEEQE